MLSKGVEFLRNEISINGNRGSQMASRGVNKVILVGNLGKDPETRYMPNGGAVTNITLATSESWNDRQTGQQVEKTEWHRVVFFNRLAEVAGEYLKKGSKVYVEGKLQTRKWQAQDGSDRYTTEIVANEMQMLDSRGGMGSDAGGGYDSGYNQQAPQGAPQGQPQKPQGNANMGQPAQAPQSTGFDDFDDDIPF